MHRLFFFSVQSFSLCGIDLNLAQAYKGCRSVVQRMQRLLTGLEFTVKEGTVLLNEDDFLERR